MDVTIDEIQGSELLSGYAGEEVATRGVVTGHSRKGFFLQTTQPGREDASAAIFVYSPKLKLTVGYEVEVAGKVVDYCATAHDRPSTQLQLQQGTVLGRPQNPVEVTWLDTDHLTADSEQVARYLNRLEGMLVGIRRGATFVAPSNSFGDYVVVPEGWPGLRTAYGGLLIDSQQPLRWLPSFRVLDYAKAPRVNVGARLATDVVGPLNYRANAFQIVALAPPAVVVPPALDLPPTALVRKSGLITVMTVNGFNLDPHIESKRRVADPGRDVDDDRGLGRFRGLARAIVQRGGAPDVVALQEIQDADGAEQTANTDAAATLQALTAAIREVGGPRYAWADIPPEVGRDGGQPGGNIRNAYLYDPDTVDLVAGSLARLGLHDEAFEATRKPLVATFRCRAAPGWTLDVVNVHLASKRHQRGVFAPEQPGFDPHHARRVSQAACVNDHLGTLGARDYYVTGDFNDYEFSDTLRAVCGTQAVNMVDRLPPVERYDYNHRGVSLVLMHGVVSVHQADAGRVEYEILHGNEMLGVTPGEPLGKPSDHAYVIARFAPPASVTLSD